MSGKRKELTAEERAFKFRLCEIQRNSYKNETSFAKALGVSQQVVHYWLSGERSPSITNLCKIADALGCTTEYLLKRSDIPTGTPELSAAAEYTGLSEVCIEKIRRINSLSPQLITALSFLLEDYGFYRIVLEDVSWFIRNSSLANNNAEDDDFIDFLSEEELDLLGKLVDEHHIQLVGPERAARSCAKEAGTGLEHLLSRKIRPTEKLVQYWQEDDNQWISLQEKINEDRRESKEE